MRFILWQVLFQYGQGPIILLTWNSILLDFKLTKLFRIQAFSVQRMLGEVFIIIYCFYNNYNYSRLLLFLNKLCLPVFFQYL